MHRDNANNNDGFHPKKRKRKNNILIMFDESARREFLTGFHKRKVQKKHKAMEEFEKHLKIERKRIKTESKAAYKKLLMTQKPIPQLRLHSEEIDMDTHCVTVTELSAAELAKSNNWIGINEIRYQRDHELGPSQLDDVSEVQGMEIKDKKRELHGKKQFSQKRRDLKKEIKKQAILNIKNSQIFKKKSRIEKIKHIKKQKKEERKRKKLRKQKMSGS